MADVFVLREGGRTPVARGTNLQGRRSLRPLWDGSRRAYAEMSPTFLQPREPTVSDRPSKRVEQSRVTMTRLMRPQHSNFAQNVHGGTLLSLMDEVAYMCAAKYAESYCVTAAIDRVEFESPVKVGEEVTMEAAVHAVGRSSMQVGIDVHAEDPQKPGSARRTNRSFFTMVALDGEGGTKTVPELICETEEERRLKVEAELREELWEELEQQLDEGMCEIEPAREA